MESFNKLEEYEPKKDREIKVSVNDLYYLFGQIYNHTAEHIEEIDEEDFRNINKLFNKYLVCNKLRDEEALWFDIMKRLDSVKPEPGTEGSQQKSRREAYGYYIQAKHAREHLQKELA